MVARQTSNLEGKNPLETLLPISELTNGLVVGSSPTRDAIVFLPPYEEGLAWEGFRINELMWLASVKTYERIMVKKEGEILIPFKFFHVTFSPPLTFVFHSLFTSLAPTLPHLAPRKLDRDLYVSRSLFSDTLEGFLQPTA